MGQPRPVGPPQGQGKHSWGGGGAFRLEGQQIGRGGGGDNSGGSSGARCDPGEVLSLLHVPNWEMVKTS